MYNIFNLIKFDFITIKKKSLVVFLVLFSLASIFSIFTMPIIISFLTLFSGFIIEPCFVLGEKNKIEKLYGILPIKRYEPIVARYLMLVIVNLLGGGLTLLVIKIGTNINLYMDEYQELLFSKTTFDSYLLLVSIVIMFGMILLAFDFFVLYVWGSSLQIFATISLAIGISVVGFGIMKIMNISMSDISYWQLNVLIPYLSKNSIMSAVISILIGVVFIAISCFGAIQFKNVLDRGSTS
jgi:hypothetical protein